MVVGSPPLGMVVVVAPGVVVVVVAPGVVVVVVVVEPGFANGTMKFTTASRCESES